MKQEEYIKTIVYNGHMINIGNDDYGQQYFLEYVEYDGTLMEVGCGSYNGDYMHMIESLFGDPKDCEHYGFGMCENIMCHGFCGRCPYNEFIVSRNIRMKMQGQKIDKEEKI